MADLENLKGNKVYSLEKLDMGLFGDSLNVNCFVGLIVHVLQFVQKTENQKKHKVWVLHGKIKITLWTVNDFTVKLLLADLENLQGGKVYSVEHLDKGLVGDRLKNLEVEDKFQDKVAEKQVGILDIEAVDNLAGVDLQDHLSKEK